MISGLVRIAVPLTLGIFPAPIFIRIWAAAPINVQKTTSAIDSPRVRVRCRGLTKVDIPLLENVGSYGSHRWTFYNNASVGVSKQYRQIQNTVRAWYCFGQSL